ncbi:biogenesis of lysosome-related organelles complex 1 subunit 5 isoform X3 [Cuculus canorus]|uniref:biogenesis of lysosome-related organelles complex 1 subunit 5 isoform X3 n=1 Tax=Cuculus canorus TaxID=55661 RepID=UPI0023AA64E7|nr:biogenesis of lysosome-related organelles complex 1 subunit 5 isoform X3 [Cuculus canorus]
MSGSGPASPGRSGASPLPSEKKRESLAAGSPIQPIVKDVGEIYSRLLDHRPVIQGEIRYFVKEFEEKRGLRELRVLENLKNTIFETNEHVLPKCEQAMHDNLNEAFKRLQAANNMIRRLQEKEHEERKGIHQVGEIIELDRGTFCSSVIPKPSSSDGQADGS